MKRSIYIALALCISSKVFAIEPEHKTENFWYLGVDLGRGSFSQDDFQHSFNDNDLVGGAHIGYKFNEYLSSELAYQYLGKVEAGIAIDDYQQLALSGLLGYPVADRLFPYIKVGAGKALQRNEYTNDQIRLILGAGIAYAITDNIDLRMEYQFTDSVGDSLLQSMNHNQAAFGVSWRFGQSHQYHSNAVLCNENSQQEIQPHLGEPGLQVNHADKNAVKVISDRKIIILFEFNKSNIPSDVELDKVLSILQKDTSLYLDIIGHTDNIGYADYNYKLSFERAMSVSNYFINNGISKDRLNVFGGGEVNPVENNNTSLGRAKNRRVEIIIR